MAVPGEEIQWHLPIPTAAEEAQQEIACLELAVLEFSRVAQRRASHFQVRPAGFDGLGGDLVQLEVLVVGASPHRRLVLRLVPDFPVTDVIAEAAGPAFVVVPDDGATDVRPFAEVLWR